MDASFQPQVLDPHAANPQPVQPANGLCFQLEELYRMLDCSTVEVVVLTDELILITDEESKFRNPAYLNLLATYLWHAHQPAARGFDCIVGRALYCHTSQFE
jgi:hypothetical protein